MKAWQYNGPGQPLQLVERETPRPGPDEVLIEVRAAGLCASDVHILEAPEVLWLVGKPPRILGHEIAGVVAEIGPGVAHVKVGDRVVVSGDITYAPGFQVDGGYATHTVIKAHAVKPIPDGVPFEQAAPATDAGQTSYGAVVLAGELKKGQKVGIVGLGGLGLTGARLAVVNGASEVYAAEPRREVWDTARKLGVKEVFEDVLKMPRDLDLIVDFAGIGPTTAGAVEIVKFEGMVVFVTASPDHPVDMTDMINKRVTLRGSHGGMPGATEAVLAHMQRGELEIQSTTIGFDDIPEGLERLGHGGVVGRLVAAIPPGAA